MRDARGETARAMTSPPTRRRDSEIVSRRASAAVPRVSRAGKEEAERADANAGTTFDDDDEFDDDDDDDDATARSAEMDPSRAFARAPSASSPSTSVTLRRNRWRADGGPLKHERDGRTRWYVTAEDGTKEAALWQIELTKTHRRATALERERASLWAKLSDASARLTRERDARVAMESDVRAMFERPVVKDALRSGVDAADGADTAMRVFKALEDRITRDREALQAADARELRIVDMLRTSEREKMEAFAAARRATSELDAHVARLRVDAKVRSDVVAKAERATAEGRNASAMYEATREKLVEATLELEKLREKDANREELIRVAVERATANERRRCDTEATKDAAKTRAALAEMSKKHAEQEGNHARMMAETRAELKGRSEDTIKRAADLEREAYEAHREALHADHERARVAEEAGNVVEGAIRQREWALTALERCVEAEEAFTKKLHYELYVAASLAVPDTVGVTDEDEALHKETSVIAKHVKTQLSELKEELRGLRHDAVYATKVATDAARLAGIAEGAEACAKLTREAHALASWGRDATYATEDEPGLRKIAEVMDEEAALARRESSRGEPRRLLMEYLGRELPPPATMTEEEAATALNLTPIKPAHAAVVEEGENESPAERMKRAADPREKEKEVEEEVTTTAATNPEPTSAIDFQRAVSANADWTKLPTFDETTELLAKTASSKATPLAEIVNADAETAAVPRKKLTFHTGGFGDGDGDGDGDGGSDDANAATTRGSKTVGTRGRRTPSKAPLPDFFRTDSAPPLTTSGYTPTMSATREIAALVKNLRF